MADRRPAFPLGAAGRAEMTGAQAALLADGRRLHLHHGPIDLLIEADGSAREIRLAYAQASDRFGSVLAELVKELPALRRPARIGGPGAAPPVALPVARRMASAAARFLPAFVTPMAAVAGAVAEEVLGAMTAGRVLRRAYVNNGGDIALHLTAGTRFDVGVVARPDRPELVATLAVRAADAVRGVATSGRHGRSLSLGIADSVTVLAGRASVADVAATLIANEVDLPNSIAVKRQPARDLDPDSDLGERLVVTGVGRLSDHEIRAALKPGLALARRYRDTGLIQAAAICLGGTVRVLGDRPAAEIHQTAAIAAG